MPNKQRLARIDITDIFISLLSMFRFVRVLSRSLSGYFLRISRLGLHNAALAARPLISAYQEDDHPSPPPETPSNDNLRCQPGGEWDVRSPLCTQVVEAPWRSGGGRFSIPIERMSPKTAGVIWSARLSMLEPQRDDALKTMLGEHETRALGPRSTMRAALTLAAKRSAPRAPASRAARRASRASRQSRLVATYFAWSVWPIACSPSHLLLLTWTMCKRNFEAHEIPLRDDYSRFTRPR